MICVSSGRKNGWRDLLFRGDMKRKKILAIIVGLIKRIFIVDQKLDRQGLNEEDLL